MSPSRASLAAAEAAALAHRLVATDDPALDLNPPGICEKLTCELRPAHTEAKRVDVRRARRRQKVIWHAGAQMASLRHACVFALAKGAANALARTWCGGGAASGGIGKVRAIARASRGVRGPPRRRRAHMITVRKQPRDADAGATVTSDFGRHSEGMYSRHCAFSPRLTIHPAAGATPAAISRQCRMCVDLTSLCQNRLLYCHKLGRCAIHSRSLLYTIATCAEVGTASV